MTTMIDPAILHEHGYQVVRSVVEHSTIEELQGHCESIAVSGGAGQRRGGHRLTVDHPIVERLLARSAFKSLADAALSGNAFVTRALLFDKNRGANWSIRWHRDETIAVRERRDVPGFGPWSVKDGVIHVRPPREILEGMIALRLHLDDAGSETGGLLLVPGSHQVSRARDQSSLPTEEERARAVCPSLSTGDVLVMRPLVYHASRKLEGPSQRRVLHLEFASRALPDPLRWNARSAR